MSNILISPFERVRIYQLSSCHMVEVLQSKLWDIFSYLTTLNENQLFLIDSVKNTLLLKYVSILTHLGQQIDSSCSQPLRRSRWNNRTGQPHWSSEVKNITQVDCLTVAFFLVTYIAVQHAFLDASKCLELFCFWIKYTFHNLIRMILRLKLVFYV